MSATGNDDTQRLRRELARLQRVLVERRLIDRAKCRLMERRRLSERDAYRTLRQLAMDHRLTLAEMASRVLSGVDEPVDDAGS